MITSPPVVHLAQVDSANPRRFSGGYNIFKQIGICYNYNKPTGYAQ
jgi:hypothetical protein